MGVFSKNSRLVRSLKKMGYVMLLTFFIVIFSLPIITIPVVLASFWRTYLHYVEVDEPDVFSAFFHYMKVYFKKGLLLGILDVAAFFVLGTCLHFGVVLVQSSIFGIAYLSIMSLLALAALGGFIHQGYVIAELDTDILSFIRISLYFGVKRPFLTIWMGVLLLLGALLVWFYAPFVFFFPFLFCEFTKGGIYRNLWDYMSQFGIYSEKEFCAVYFAKDPIQTSET